MTFGEAFRSVVVRALVPGLIIFAVLGGIFFGIATPTEAAAIGAVASLALGLATRKIGWRGVVESCVGTVRTTTMIFAIVLGSTLYAQLMSFSGATNGFVEYGTKLVSGTACMEVGYCVVH